MINEQVANVVSEKDGLSDDAVKCITQGTDGCYYVGTTGKMSVLSMAGGLSVKKVIDDVTYAVSIDADKSGNVAAVSDSGKLNIIRDTDVISQYVPADGSTYTTCTFEKVVPSFNAINPTAFELRFVRTHPCKVILCPSYCSNVSFNFFTNIVSPFKIKKTLLNN